MESTLVRPLDDFEVTDFSNWPSNPYEQLWTQLKRFMQSRQHVSVLIFGPQGVGKTRLAVTIAKRASDSFPKCKALFVDCARVAMLPEVMQRRRTQAGIREEVSGIDLLRESRDGWILVLDDVDALASYVFLSFEGRRVWARVNSIHQLPDESQVKIILATSRDPSSMTPELREWFDLMFYMSPFPFNEIVNWFTVAGLTTPAVSVLSNEVDKLLAPSHVQGVVPYAFMTAVRNTLRQGALSESEAPIFAKRLCIAANPAFLDENTVRRYESDNRAFIVQSNFLTQLP